MTSAAAEIAAAVYSATCIPCANPPVCATMPPSVATPTSAPICRNVAWIPATPARRASGTAFRTAVCIGVCTAASARPRSTKPGIKSGYRVLVTTAPHQCRHDAHEAGEPRRTRTAQIDQPSPQHGADEQHNRHRKERNARLVRRVAEDLLEVGAEEDRTPYHHRLREEEDGERGSHGALAQ